MILKHFRNILLLGALALGVSPALAGKAEDDAVLAAYDAYRAGDVMKLSRLQAKLANHLLDPWIDYWKLVLRLEDATASDVQAFHAEHGSAYVAERLRGEWLKVLGRRGDWAELEREAPAFKRDDLEVRCYGWLARLARNDESAWADAMGMWLEPKELPDGCARLAAFLNERSRLSVTDIWHRVRVLFQNGQIAAAKSALALLPKAEAPDERALADAASNPKRLIDRPPQNMERRAAREVAVLAGIRYARLSPQSMAEALSGSFGASLPEAEAKHLWGRVGYEGARSLNDQSLRWFARAGDARLDDEQLAWKVRAALRRGQWALVRDSIDRMSPATRHDPAWSYWYGRALASQGEEAGARAYYLRIAGQTDFYGLLANEELGYVGTVPEQSHVPTDEQVAAMSREPGLRRAQELMRLGLRTEGVREWLFTIREMDDTRLIAAAAVAHKAEIYDRTISTADRTTRVHNFTLRYPVPFRDVFREHARTQGLDEAWVLGLVRQESRFITDAKSSAGAAGLMQLMPATARYVARKIGLHRYEHRMVTEVKTNVSLGTGYMRMVLDQLGHPVLASAAYNAGPGRARRWRDARPLEGAIYAESIPFNETRDYVKKVMANSVFYAALLQKKITPLKERLGTIPARSSGEVVDEELP
jgi:soluble lytic murein transglycosylase